MYGMHVYAAIGHINLYGRSQMCQIKVGTFPVDVAFLSYHVDQDFGVALHL
ncbi:hypothetical protein MTR_1g082518 [Medicago truncatula]|uniref:Uncharacterized protein n=1 Tax=Medicago truncatula TaxID=3880 RepID=A0A072VM34_MEDTR|nr:hypothetical protein MTR_1g082518 [Medicago truncatula]